VIETLSAGYAAINRQLWVLLLPVAVDMFLWLGPHVSYSPLVAPTVTRATEWVRHATPEPAELGQPSIASDLEDIRQRLVEYSDETNALSLVANGPLALPSLSGWVAESGDLTFVTGWPEGLALLTGCFVASLLLGGCFYGAIARAATRAPGGLLPVAQSAPGKSLRVLGFVAAALGLGLLLGLPMLLLMGFALLVAPVVAYVGAVALLAAVVYAALHLSFATAAIFVSNVGPLAAIRRSVRLVRRNLYPALGLLGLTWLILAGMAQVWLVLANNLPAPVGVGLSTLGNAYIASGLVAASMIFYLERADGPA
jgi:hypothetical protein